MYFHKTCKNCGEEFNSKKEGRDLCRKCENWTRHLQNLLRTPNVNEWVDWAKRQKLDKKIISLLTWERRREERSLERS